MHLTLLDADLFTLLLRAEIVNKDLGRQGASSVLGTPSRVLLEEPPLPGWGTTGEIGRHLRRAKGFWAVVLTSVCVHSNAATDRHTYMSNGQFIQ